MNNDWKLLVGVLIAAALTVRVRTGAGRTGQRLGQHADGAAGAGRRRVGRTGRWFPARRCSPPRCRGLLPGLAAPGRSPRPGFRPTSERPRRRARPAERFPPAKSTGVTARCRWAASARKVILLSDVMPAGLRMVSEEQGPPAGGRIGGAVDVVDPARAAKADRDPADLSGRQADDSARGLVARPAATRQDVRGARVGQDAEAVGRRHRAATWN